MNYFLVANIRPKWVFRIWMDRCAHEKISEGRGRAHLIATCRKAFLAVPAADRSSELGVTMRTAFANMASNTRLQIVGRTLR